MRMCARNFIMAVAYALEKYKTRQGIGIEIHTNIPTATTKTKTKKIVL